MYVDKLHFFVSEKTETETKMGRKLSKFTVLLVILLSLCLQENLACLPIVVRRCKFVSVSLNFEGFVKSDCLAM